MPKQALPTLSGQRTPALAPGARTLAAYASMLTFDASLLILALVCSRLHRRLLEPALAS